MKAVLICTLVIASSLSVDDAVPIPATRGKAIIPFPVKECTATNLQRGQKPVVDCELADVFADENAFDGGTTLSLPEGDFARCTFAPDNEGKVFMGCLGIPTVVDPNEQATVEDGIVSLPTSAAECVLTSLQICPGDTFPANPVVECTPPAAGSNGQTFRAGETFDISGGNLGRCELAAGPNGEVIAACVGIPVSAFPPPGFTGAGTVTLPEGAASCVVSFSQGQVPIVSCENPINGCGQPVFGPNATVDETPGARCTYVANADGTADAVSCVL